MTIYITGHKNPDSDSIVASIAYAYLKNELGEEAIPCRLGSISQETEYLLNRFDFPTPQLLEDARCTLGEIELLPATQISQDATLFEALQTMKQAKQPFLAVHDQNHKIIGMITRNVIANLGVEDTAYGIEMLQHTKPSDLVKTLNGKEIYIPEHLHLNGKVSIVALSSHRALRYQVQERMVIVSDDPIAQKELIEKGAGMLILVWCDSIEDDVLEAAKQHECAIILSGHGSMNTSRYLYFSLPVSALMSTKLITFERSEYVEDVIRKMSRYRYRSYPIVFEEQLCGYLEAGKMLYPPTKNMILVDHNEFSQSVKNIEKASVLEVIDHHRIHDFTSTRPVYFRNETVGSTCTIVTSLFFEHNIPIPRQLAGLLLGAMISDTLNFQSPTTTQKDIDLAQRLANLAHETIDELAYDIFFSNDLSQKDINDFLQEDMKHFEITNYQVAIAQSIIPQSSLLSIQEQELKEKMEAYTKRSGIDLYVFALTSILENGTYFYISGPLAQQLQQNLDQTHFFPNILSRKKQIVPLITNWIQEAN